MGEVERIADQLERAFEGDAWHGPPVMKIIDGITARQAARPFSNAHSIWEILLHIGAWERACLRRLNGDRAELSAFEDWPEVTDVSEHAWEEARKALKESHDALRAAILRLDESRLDEPIVAGMSTVYVTLHGIVQHDLYHAGQIAILKKAASEGERI